MRIDYSHHLTCEEAYRRIDRLLSDLQRKYIDKIKNPQISWNLEHTRMDYNVEILGFNAEGLVILDDRQVSIDGKVPFAVRIFSGKIEEIVRKHLDDMFS